MVSVREALLTDALSGCRVVAGEKGLDREVRTVIIGEIPDIQNWLRGGDFVATTAYIMSQQTASNMKEWIVGLFEHGAAALAIKTKRFIPAIPQEVIDLGNQLDFPIIELSESAGQSEISRQIFGLIINRQNEMLRHSQNVQKSLIDLFLRGEELDGIADTMTKLIKNPVLIESAYGDLLGYSTGPYISKEQILSYYAEKRGKRIDLNTLIDSDKKSLIKLEQSGINPQWPQLIAPIITNEKVYGFVSVLEINHTLSEWDIGVIEPMCVVIALELYKQRELYQEEKKIRNGFLQFVLEEDFVKAKRLANELGFKLATPLFCIVAHFDRASKGKQRKFVDIESFNINISKHITHLVNQEDSNACIICTDDELVIFSHFYTELGQAKQEQIVKKIVHRIITSVQGAKNKLKITIGIGRAYDGLPGLRQSYFEALEAVNVINDFCLTTEIANYGELGYYRLLSSLVKDLPKSIAFCKDTLGGLLMYEKEHAGSLLTTLDRYIFYNGNKAELARSMYLHVNTVQYRIKKIEEILGIDLDVQEVRLNLWIALKIYPLVKERI